MKMVFVQQNLLRRIKGAVTCAVGCGGQDPHLAAEPLNGGWCDRGAAF